jgi:hypothetical protein
VEAEIKESIKPGGSMARITKEVLYLRRDFTKDDKLDMGSKLAESYNLMSDIEEEEAVMKSQIKERKSQVEATIGTLSRNLANGYTMLNVDCELLYDTPHVGEVSYKRKDNGQITKTRAMTESENQQEIEFHEAKVVEPAPVEESVVNIETFFGKGTTDARTMAEEAEAEEDDVLTSSDPDDAKEATKPEHDALFAEPKKGRGRPKGSTNKAKDEDEPF